MITTEAVRVRIVLRAAAGLLVAALLVYPLDWLVWRLRVAGGSGMGTVTVRTVTAATLKGGKSEYYTDGPTEVDCSRSVFPQAGAGACWWLQRHPEITLQD